MRRKKKEIEQDHKKEFFKLLEKAVKLPDPALCKTSSARKPDKNI